MEELGIKDAITNNFAYLTENLCNIDSVLNILIEQNVLSFNEREYIMSQTTSIRRNVQLFTTLIKKDILTALLVSVLHKTGNSHLARKIMSTHEDLNDNPLVQNMYSTQKLFTDLTSRTTSLNTPEENQNQEELKETIRNTIVDLPENVASSSENYKKNTESFSDPTSYEEELGKETLISNENEMDDLADTEMIAMISPGEIPKSLLNFKDVKMFGEGSYGKVFRVKNKLSGKDFAIKIAKDVECHRERQNLSKVNHPNIITYIDSWDESVNDEINRLDLPLKGYRTLYCIQTEWCNGGDLDAWISLPEDDKSENDAKRICFQIACGVEYLHTHPDHLLHRDLKPENIFLLHDYKKNNPDLQVKIGDLGLCRSTMQRSKGSRAHQMTIKVGNKNYMAPEVRDGKDDYTTAVDIYAIALIFYELIMATSENDAEFDVHNDHITSKWFIQKFPKENQLLKTMLSNDAEKRPKAQEIRDFFCKEWQMN